MDLQELLDHHDGIATRATLLRELGRHRTDNVIKSGQIQAVFPRTYVRPWDLDLLDVQRRAALLSTGGDVALSHVTALEVRDLPVVPGQPLHVTAYQTRHPRGVPERLVVHRTLRPLDAVEHIGLPAVRLETALTTSWPMASGAEQRAPLLEARRRRMLNLVRLGAITEQMWWVTGIADMRRIVALVLAGCESELELWGYSEVFDVPGLRDFTSQRVVRVDGKKYRIDIAYEQERLAVELDGRQFHASDEQWAKDIARDLALATIGWQTIRLPHSRLLGDVAGCRRDVLDVRNERRRLVGLPRAG